MVYCPCQCLWICPLCDQNLSGTITAIVTGSYLISQGNILSTPNTIYVLVAEQKEGMRFVSGKNMVLTLNTNLESLSPAENDFPPTVLHPCEDEAMSQSKTKLVGLLVGAKIKCG